MKPIRKKRSYLILLAAGMVVLFSACALASQNNGTALTPTDTAEPERTSAAAQSTATLQRINETTPAAGAGLDLDLQTDLIQVYEVANPSVVYIVTDTGSGSGFVYDRQGHIVTNQHVIASTRSLEVVFSNGDRRRASVVGSDEDGDLAVIQVDSLPEGVQPLPIAAEDDLRVGQLVVAIGNPFGEQGSMSMGIVSGLGRSLPSQMDLATGSAYSLPEVIQTDAPINPGNSGGPLLNLNGEVVGVNAAIASASGTSSGVGFSIPVKAVRMIVPELIESGGHEYSYIGAGFDGEITLDEENLYGLTTHRGAYVVSVTPGSPADRAGLQAASSSSGRGGDLVVAVDGQPVNNFNDLNSYLVFDTQPGQTVELTVVRDGREIAVPLTLGSRP